jgi:1-aminocyclopropane-1-carboxylate deaminase
MEGLISAAIPVTHLNRWASPGVQCAVARLDLIHPCLSGNKLFKLWYYLEKYRTGSFDGLVTFGGAYSNHLLATAYACHMLGIPSTGIVRGEAPASPGPTLEDCARYGMELRYVSRQAYKDPERIAGELNGCPLIVPEGGAGEQGVRGAALICGSIPGIDTFTHILCAAGTGTTISGIDRALLPGQSAIGIPVLKIPAEDQAGFSRSLGCSNRTRLLFDYSFGGYARWNRELTGFMGTFYADHGVPTDFVYTAKAAYALSDLAKQGYFPSGSRILLIHTGGLQGNRSLPSNILGF